MFPGSVRNSRLLRGLKLIFVREARMEADLVPNPEAHERLELNNIPQYKLLF